MSLSGIASTIIILASYGERLSSRCHVEHGIEWIRANVRIDIVVELFT